ncbi:unnamed protein product [Rotaria magnacalcarata]|uniref:Uncharacterized protein n=1 Tax=Rotaria magnacalcarata TaxID=392030 RepID=A0A819D9C5_9BILA|nr:unnamed protein product [Rotaria magnacalcarata]
MQKQNKFNRYDGIILASEEYRQWILHPYDENGKIIPFQGVQYCCICSKYYRKKDEQQTENLQQDSKDLKQVIIHQDEPEDSSVVINPKMKLLATI